MSHHSSSMSQKEFYKKIHERITTPKASQTRGIQVNPIPQDLDAFNQTAPLKDLKTLGDKDNRHGKSHRHIHQHQNPHQHPHQHAADMPHVPDGLGVRFSEGIGENTFQEKIHLIPSKVEEKRALREKGQLISPRSGAPGYRPDTGDILDQTCRAHVPDGTCYCKECTCGLHFCPSTTVRYKYPNLQSHYMESFMNRKALPKTEIFDYEKNKKKLFPGQQVMAVSTYKMDYPAHKVKPTQLMKERPMTAAVPFTGASSYANQYPNWGTNKHEAPPKRGYKPNDVPFRGETSYGNQFVPPKTGPAESMRPKPMLKNSAPFQGTTTSMNDFQPFKVHGQPTKMFKHEKMSPTYTFPGQYDTQAKKDYSKKPATQCKFAYPGKQPPNKWPRTIYFDPLSKRYS